MLQEEYMGVADEFPSKKLREKERKAIESIQPKTTP
jgi:hypothetical protein